MQMRSAPSVLGLILFYHYIILHELIYAPWNFFRGSLIPRQPFVGGRNATQSASRGDLVVQCRTDYLVANRLVWLDIVLPSKFLQRHAQQSSDKREKEDVKRNNYIRIKQPIPAAYSEIFFIGGRSILSTTCPFYTGCPKPVFDSNFHHRFSFSCLSGNGLL